MSGAFRLLAELASVYPDDVPPDGRPSTYDECMSTKPITITVDEDLHAYVQAEVEAGRATSVSAFLNAAATRAMRLDRRADAAWKAAVERAQQNPQIVERSRRIVRHVEEQARIARERHEGQDAPRVP
jgi:Arc/MetJ-type ribon-helix-helix transcriptional regulator